MEMETEYRLAEQNGIIIEIDLIFKVCKWDIAVLHGGGSK